MVWTEEEELLSSLLDRGELRPRPEVLEYFRGSARAEEPRPVDRWNIRINKNSRVNRILKAF